jgi:8-oxo-dGTP pyrophosphatase MutT (NUDIX family)
VRQYRHGTGEFHFDLPGGRIGHSDVSQIDSARRDFLEETGLEADDFETIG